METARLILRKAVFDDWRDIYGNLWRHEESARYMLWNVTKDEEAAQARIQRTIDYQREHLAYVVEEKASGQVIGFAGLEEIQPQVYEDTGVAIGPAFVRQGYGREILNELVRYVFEELHAKKLICSCRSQNVASRELQLACGFTYSHSEKRTDPRTGQEYELEFYERICGMEGAYGRKECND